MFKVGDKVKLSDLALELFRAIDEEAQQLGVDKA